MSEQLSEKPVLLGGGQGYWSNGKTYMDSKWCDEKLQAVMDEHALLVKHMTAELGSLLAAKLAAEVQCKLIEAERDRFERRAYDIKAREKLVKFDIKKAAEEHYEKGLQDAVAAIAENKELAARVKELLLVNGSLLREKLGSSSAVSILETKNEELLAELEQTRSALKAFAKEEGNAAN